MPTTRLKEKLSSIVASQLPEHIRADYPTFVKFIEAYYEFLEQDQNSQELLQNALEYNDIDRTASSFIDYFLKQYLPLIPRSVLADKKLLVKKINDLYSSKGSVKSYELLFRLLYNSTPEVSFPGDLILKASSGEWNQRTTVYIQKVVGDPYSIINSQVTVSNANKQTTVRLGRNYTVPVLEDGVIKPSTSIFEYDFDNSTNVSIDTGDEILTDSFRGIVRSAPVRITIVNPGTSFRVGSIFEVSINNAVNLKFKVSKVTSTGGLEAVQILSYGCLYPDKFLYPLVASPAVVPRSTTVITSNTDPSGNVTYTSNLSSKIGLLESFGNILSAANVTLSVFKYGAEVSNASVEDTAIIRVSSGSKIFYPGVYKTSSGFLSDDYKLQDRDYYQPFSYLIKSLQQLNEYKKVILDTVHPAGTKLLGEYVLLNTIIPTINLSSALGLDFNDLSDVYGVIDSERYFSTTKVLLTTFTTLDPLSYTLSLPKQDTFSLDDNTVSKVFIASYSSNVLMVDSNVQVTAQFNRSPQSNVIILDSDRIFELTKNTVSSASLLDNNFLLEQYLALSSSSNTSEIINILFTTNIASNTAITSSSVFEFTKLVNFDPDYTSDSEPYFLELYVTASTDGTIEEITVFDYGEISNSVVSVSFT